MTRTPAMTPDEQKRLLRERGICVVIPVYNNEGTVRRVVEDTLAQCDDVIVVDDGSTDGTAAILRGMEGITLVSYPRNRGKGHALREGFRRAMDMGFAYAVTLDADGQHYPADIARLLDANRRHPGALIVGCRQLQGVDRSTGSTFANRFSNFWFFVQTWQPLADTQTGYRLYPLRKLRGLALLTSRYEAELELLVFASWHGVRLVSVPVRVYYPPRSERVSHFRPVADFARITLLNTVLCQLAVVYGLPLRLWRALAAFVRTAYSLLFFLFFSLVVLTPFVWVYVRLGAMTERRRLGLHRLIWHASRFVMLRHGIPGTTFRSSVPDNVHFDRPRIIICNHQSHLDLMCQLVFTPKVVFLTNSWVWHNPFYGQLIRHAEYLPVVDGLEPLMPRLRSLVERGYSIAVYPEGTRSADCRIGRFHQGAFYLARELGLDILPMILYGPGKVLPKKSHHLHRAPFYVEVGQPLTPADLAAMGDLRQQAATLRRRYRERYEAIANRLERDA